MPDVLGACVSEWWKGGQMEGVPTEENCMRSDTNCRTVVRGMPTVQTRKTVKVTFTG